MSPKKPKRGQGGRTTPKKTKPQSGSNGKPGSNNTDDAPRDNVLEFRSGGSTMKASGIQALVAELRGLLAESHPYPFLAHVSAIAETFDDLRLTHDQRAEAGLLDPSDLFESFAEAGTRETTAALVALTELGVEEEHRDIARALLEAPDQQTLVSTLPKWLRQLGDTEVVDAVSIADPYGDISNEAVGLRLPGGADLTVVLVVDHLLGRAAIDAVVVEDPLDALRKNYLDHSGNELHMTFNSISAALAGARFGDAQEISRDLDPPITTDRWPAAAPITGWTQRLLGDEFDPEGDPFADDLDGSTPDQLRHDYLASEPGSAFQQEQAKISVEPFDVEPMLDTLLDWATATGSGDPRRWSPDRAAQFLFEAVPDLAEPTPTRSQLLAFPGLLQSWVRVVHPGSTLPESLHAETVDAIDEMRAELDGVLAGNTEDPGE